jgi:hypothetical protein
MKGRMIKPCPQPQGQVSYRAEQAAKRVGSGPPPQLAPLALPISSAAEGITDKSLRFQ